VSHHPIVKRIFAPKITPRHWLSSTKWNKKNWKKEIKFSGCHKLTHANVNFYAYIYTFHTNSSLSKYYLHAYVTYLFILFFLIIFIHNPLNRDDQMARHYHSCSLFNAYHSYNTYTIFHTCICIHPIPTDTYTHTLQHTRWFHSLRRHIHISHIFPKLPAIIETLCMPILLLLYMKSYHTSTYMLYFHFLSPICIYNI